METHLETDDRLAFRNVEQLPVAGRPLRLRAFETWISEMVGFVHDDQPTRPKLVAAS
jgi:hypothetical protein